MFILEILIYVLFAYIMFACVRSSYNEETTEGFIVGLWAFVIFYTFICAVRWGVGVDSIDYARMFKFGLTNWSIENRGNEYIWSYFVNFIYNNKIHYTVGMGICAFLQILFISKALNSYRYILLYIPLVMFGGKYFLNLQDGMRQMVVACYFLYASKWIAEKKISTSIVYFGTLWVAHYIHNSALLLFLFYFMPNNLKIAKYRWIPLGMFLFCFVLGRTPQFQGLVSFVASATGLIGYDDYTDRVSDLLLEGQTAESLSFGPMMLSYFVCSAAVIWFGPQLKEEYEEKVHEFNLWYNFSYLYSCFYFLICNVSHLLIRPVNYLLLFLMVMNALVLCYLKTHWGETIILKMNSKLIFHMLVFSIWVNCAWQMYKSTNDVNTSLIKIEYATYKTIFNHEIK